MEEIRTELIKYEDFAKLELRTAKVLAVEPHPNADRLYLLTIDGGTEQRKIVAGIKAHYTAEELIGRTIIVVWNLEPATIRGVVSQGMLLAASSVDRVSVLSPDKEMPPGCKVK